MKYIATFNIPDDYKIGCASAKICPDDGKIRCDADFENAYADTVPVIEKQNKITNKEVLIRALQSDRWETLICATSYIDCPYGYQTNHFRFDDDAQIRMEINAYYKIPKSTSKKRAEMMLANEVRPTKKPDMDNIVKIIADSLNNIAYRDDAQIVSCTCNKWYSDNPSIYVTLEEIQ